MFASREEAGKLLGEKLRYLASEKPVILGITRGGVVVAAEVAKILKAPLYPLVIKKISSAWNPEFAVGAIGPDLKVTSDVTDITDVTEDQIKDLRNEIKEKIKECGVEDLGARIKNKTVIIVDDGVATGWSVRAAIKYVLGSHPKQVVVAVPVADVEIAKGIRKQVSRLVVLEEVEELGAVGNFYEDFSPVTDEKVAKCISGFSPKEDWVDRRQGI